MERDEKNPVPSAEAQPIAVADGGARVHPPRAFGEFPVEPALKGIPFVFMTVYSALLEALQPERALLKPFRAQQVVER